MCFCPLSMMSNKSHTHRYRSFVVRASRLCRACVAIPAVFSLYVAQIGVQRGDGEIILFTGSLEQSTWQTTC